MTLKLLACPYTTSQLKNYLYTHTIIQIKQITIKKLQFIDQS